jgi:N2,N2-dimethylguanosine tRNA methyltransferase
MGILGSPAGPSHYLNVCRTLWPVYSTTSISLNRFLRAVVRESTDSAHRGEESCQVRRQVLRWLYFFLIYICSQTSIYYVCSGCQSFYEQPLGRVTERINDRGNPTVLFKTHVGPPVPEKCPECDSSLHIGGPMWNGQIHDPQFVGQVLEHLEDNEDKYGTSTRMKGMLTVAKEVGTF